MLGNIPLVLVYFLLMLLSLRNQTNRETSNSVSCEVFAAGSYCVCLGYCVVLVKFSVSYEL
jgi:ABC-type molybdate transport system substrate-binding protein